MSLTVFLTGATGLLGHYVLLELLQRSHRVIAFGRDTRTQSARQRITRLLVDALGSLEAVRELEPQLEVLSGSLTEPLFGLDEQTWDALLPRIDAVVHCAASLNFLPEQAEEVMRTNLLGTRNAHALATDADASLHVLSTAYVGGSLESPKHFPNHARLETPIDGDPHFNNPYERSKLLAERLLAQLDSQRGRVSTLLRPSCITGEYATGRTITFRTLYGFIDLMDQERKRIERSTAADANALRLVYFSDIPRNATRNVVPVDYVAKAVVHIVEHPELHGQIYHLVNPHPPLRWQSNRWMAQALGFADLVMPSEQHDWPPETLTHFQPGRLARFSRVFAGYLEDHEPRFDDRRTQAALAGAGIECPEVDEAYLRRVVRYCVETRWRNDAERRVDALLQGAASEWPQTSTPAEAGHASFVAPVRKDARHAP